MKNYIIKRLRECAYVPGKQKTWISELTDEQLYELFLRLRSGESAKSIARYIQKAWGVLPKSSPHSISQGILKFKRRISHLLLDRPEENTSRPDCHDMDETERLEGIEGMELIYRGQLERIDRMIKEEKETGITFPHLNRDIQALAALSKSITKASEWELVHGNVDPVKRRRLERRNQILQQNWSVFMDRLGDDGQDRMIKFINRFLEELPKMTTRIEKLSDGTLQFTEPDGTTRLVKPEQDAV